MHVKLNRPVYEGMSVLKFHWGFGSEDVGTGTDPHVQSGRGISLAEMQRELEVQDYKTIWTITPKIRKGMASPS
jgi:hypothetical protein